MLGGFAALDIPAIVGVMTGFGLCVVVPIVAMLLTHQRRMAELVHGQSAKQSVEAERIARLEMEVSRLKQQLEENIIALDDRRGTIQKLSPPPVPEQVRNA